MAVRFTPRLDVLPAAQRRLWAELGDVPPSFTLYGGTALALHLGHRKSLDFDFFSSTKFDDDRMMREIGFLQRARVLQRSAGTLTVQVTRGGQVQISFFAVPKLRRLRAAHVSPDNGVRIASLLDLAGAKAAVVQKRADAKDYVDLDALMKSGVDLAMALAAGRAIYGAGFNAQVTLKALSYFMDGDLPTLSDDVKQRLQKAVRMVDPVNLPRIVARRYSK